VAVGATVDSAVFQSVIFVNIFDFSNTKGLSFVYSGIFMCIQRLYLKDMYDELKHKKRGYLLCILEYLCASNVYI
jgi:hypothetical protein